MKIDPDAITDFNLTKSRLEKVLLFWVCAAGHGGHQSSRALEKLLRLVNTWLRQHDILPKKSPFAALRQMDSQNNDPEWMQKFMALGGIGCQTRKAEYVQDLIYSGINLRTCTVDDLEGIKGIGPKTARCFLIHSRPDQEYAGLDTHILHYLRDRGIEAPKTTPTGRRYRELEVEFIRLAKEAGKTIADFDLEIWLRYRRAEKVR
jgi:hypothetical protein